jgi:hypothetical protein
MPEELNRVKRKVAWASLVITLLLSATGLTLANLVTANPIGYLPIIVIERDGSVAPDTPFIKQDGDVYTLTGDIQQKYSILIRRSDIVFDGAGYSINCASYPVLTNIGLSLEDVTNVTVKNIEVTGFSQGYTDRWLGDVVAENTTNSAFLRVSTTVFRLVNSSFNTVVESNISSNNSLRSPELSVRGSYNNTFFKNNFSIEQFSANEGNFWDNGSLGNYWSGYDGVDENGDGIGDTPHLINANDQDRFPLMNPWDPVIPYDTVPPLISILSPESKICNESSVPLTFLIYEPASSMSYSLDGQDNITIIGNSTISDLTNGLHNVTVYVKDMCGNVGASETVSFTVEVPFPIAPVTATSVAIVAVVGVGLIVYLKKRKR